MLFDDGGLESATIMQGRGRRGHAGGAGGSGVKRNVFSAGGNATQGECTANPSGAEGESSSRGGPDAGVPC